MRPLVQPLGELATRTCAASVPVPHLDRNVQYTVTHRPDPAPKQKRTTRGGRFTAAAEPKGKTHRGISSQRTGFGREATSICNLQSSALMAGVPTKTHGTHGTHGE